MKAGIVLVSQFVVPHAEQYSEYINYMDRDEAVRTENFHRYDAFASVYMDNRDKTVSKTDLKQHRIGKGNPEKSSALFSSSSDRLSTKEKKVLKEKFQRAQKAGSPMWQNVISFDNSFLEEHGILDQATHTLDESKLREATRKAMQQKTKSEGMDGTAIWSASIHFNTDNIHVHIAMVEPTPTREKGMYRNIQSIKFFEKKPNAKKKDIYRAARRALYDQMGNPEKAGNGKANIDISLFGKSYPTSIDYSVTEQYRAKIKPGTMNRMKSEISKTLQDRSVEYTAINTLIRENMIGGKRKHISSEDALLRTQFLKIYHLLPTDRSQWQYGYNTISHLRPMIDEFSNLYIKNYCPADYKELLQRLDQEVLNAERTFGKGNDTNLSQQYKENKLNDLYKRMGNTLLTEMRNYHKNTQEGKKRAIGNGSSAQKIIRKKKSSRYLNQSLYAIRKAMKQDVQHAKNQRAYQNLMNNIAPGTDYE